MPVTSTRHVSASVQRTNPLLNICLEFTDHTVFILSKEVFYPCSFADAAIEHLRLLDSGWRPLRYQDDSVIEHFSEDSIQLIQPFFF